MNRAKKTIFIVTFMCVALLGSVLYAEKLSHENTQKELQEIVLQDISRTESFISQNSDSMRCWAEYLSIEEIKNLVVKPNEDSNRDLFCLLMTLKFANGIEKYPVFVNLRESLELMLDWQKSSFLQTAFQNRKIIEELASSRFVAQTAAGNALVNATRDLNLEERTALEIDFENQINGDLPGELLDSISRGGLSETRTLSKQEDHLMNTESLTPENTSKSRRSRLYNKLQQKHSEAQQSEEQSPTEEAEKNSKNEDKNAAEGSELEEVELLLDSTSHDEGLSKTAEPFVLGKTRSLTEYMVNEGEKNLQHSLSQIHSSLPRPPFDLGTVPQRLADATEKQSQTTEKQTQTAEETAVPDSDSDLPELSFLDELDTEESVENSDSEETKTENNSLQETKQVIELKPFANQVPSLPFLQYSLQETVGNAPDAPKYDGSETIEDLLNGLKGDFSEDFEAICKCWLLEEFQVPKDEDLTKAYENVQDVFEHFSQKLQSFDETKRQAWIEILHLEALNLEQEPQLDVLQDVYQQLSCGSVGLELRDFVNLRESIKFYLNLVSIKNNPEKAAESFAKARNRVVKLLEIVEKNHSSVVERALEDELNWLEMLNQAEETIQATRKMWAKPNLVSRADASLFERFGTRAIQEEGNVSNQIQGASIVGTSNFSGNLIMKPVVNPNQIELNVILEGSSDSQTRAYSGPAIVSSHAISRVMAEKKIFFDESGFSTDNAQVNIQTNSQIQNVQDVWNRQLIQNVATRRAYARKNQSEYEANAQNTARLRSRINQQVNEAIESWNKQLNELFQVHFLPRGLESIGTRAWSNEEGTYAQTNFSCYYGMSAYSNPPQISEKMDCQLAIHETALQGTFAGYLGGLNLTPYARKHLKETAPSFIKKAEQNSDSNENEAANDDNWSIQFPNDWPISVSIQDGKLCCVIHCNGLEVNEKSYPAVDIWVTYKMELQEDGIHFIRQDEIDILPPDFNPESNDRLPSSMVSLRRVMGKRLQEAFEKEIVMKEQPLEKNPKPDSQFANVYMKPIFVQAKDGWLQIGMNLIEKK